MISLVMLNGYLQEDKKKDIGTVENIEEDSVINDFEELVVALKEKCPDSRIIYLQMFLADEYTLSHLIPDKTLRKEVEERTDLFNQIERVCKKNGIEYVDVSYVFDKTALKYRQADYLHFKDNGYKILTSMFLEKIKNK